MSFTPAHVGPWSVGEKLTSAQMNQLDADHVNSLDKTGDTIDGTAVIQIIDTANISVLNEGGITADAGSAIKSQAVDGILINTTNGFTLSGSTNWPKFLVARDNTRIHPANPFSGTGWSYASSGGVSGQYYVGPGTASPAFFDLNPYVHNGATLSSVSLLFAVTLAHASIASMVLPKINLARTSIAVGQAATNGASLNSAGQITLAAPASAAAYVNGNLSQLLVFPCDQNNIIDKTQYKYTLIVVDENGSNSVANSTAAMGLIVANTAIPNMKFP